MTAELAFRVRALNAGGLQSDRIAELLSVGLSEVRSVLNGWEPDDVDELEPALVEGQEMSGPAVPVPAEPVDEAPSWPPAPDASTRWHEVVTHHEYGYAPTRERVRWVRLWGKDVEVNAAAEVWCPHCQRFRSTAQLGHPRNGCPVGLPPRGGLITVDEDEMAEQDAVWDAQEARRASLWGMTW
ncbi:hypothetical protein [uncultured Jatrophihabitans sp.]|uniref:hypothetical protein n=1 Tax=uncultured Jatrophihabitans sp. TaxID=1610747 RepID=UPI0035C9918D